MIVQSVTTYLRSGTPRNLTEDQIRKLRGILNQRRQLTIEQIRKIAKHFKFVEAKCRAWFVQQGVVITDGSKNNEVTLRLVSNNSHFENKLTESLSVQAKALMFQRRSTFFNELSDDKKIVLLRKTKNMTVATAQLAQELSDELHLPLERTKNWLRFKRNKLMRTRSKIMAKHIVVLKAEFNKCRTPNEDKVLLLSDLLKLSVQAIKEWFAKMRQPDKLSVKDEPVNANNIEVQHKRSLSRSDLLKYKGKLFLPKQKNILFEEFKKSPDSIDGEKIEKLAKITNLKTVQVNKWFFNVRKRWFSATLSDTKKQLNKNLSQQQVNELEKQYKKYRYLTREECTSISEKLDLKKSVVIVWFAHRRIYELLQTQTTIKNSANEINSLKLDNVSNEKTEINNVKGGIKCKSLKIELGNRNQIETLTRNIGAEKFPEKSTKPIYSNTFFNELPYFKQIRLIKEGKKQKITSDMIASIARDLDIPAPKVKNWLVKYRAQIRKQNLGGNKNVAFKPTEEQIEYLIQEFEKSDRVDKEQTETLALACGVPPQKIHNWFMNRRYRIRLGKIPKTVNKNPIEEEIISSSFVSKDGRHIKSSAQKNLLFTEFKKTPEITVSRARQISNQLGLTPTQVQSWFQKLRIELGLKNEKKLFECLITPFTYEQLSKIEEEYQKNRYLTEAKINFFKEELNTKKRFITNWFYNARFYELVTGNNINLSKSLISKSVEQIKSRSNSVFENKMNNVADSVDKAVKHINTKFKSSASQKRLIRKPSSSSKVIRLTRPKVQMLKIEFQKNPYMTEQRAKMLSRKNKISMDRIKKWFATRNTKVNINCENSTENIETNKSVDLRPIENFALSNPETVLRSVSVRVPKIKRFQKSKRAKVKIYKLPLQNNVLFEEFKNSSHLSTSRMLQLCEQLDLSTSQIEGWFSWMRRKLNTLSTETLLPSYRNKNLNKEQVKILEMEYKKTRYISDERRDAMAKELNVTRGIVKMWFANRRYYEVVLHSNCGKEGLNYIDPRQSSSSLSEINNDDIKLVNDVQDTNNKSDFNPVIISVRQITEMECIDLDNYYDNSTAEIYKEAGTCEKLEPEFVPAEGDIDIDSDIENIYVSSEFRGNLESEPETDNESTPKKVSPFLERYKGMGDRVEVPTQEQFVERSRNILNLKTDWESTEEKIEKLFWFICSAPNKILTRVSNKSLTEEDVKILEAEFLKNSKPSQLKVSELSNKLAINEPRIYWWFMKRRNILKMYVSAPDSENINESITEIINKENSNSKTTCSDEQNLDFSLPNESNIGLLNNNDSESNPSHQISNEELASKNEDTSADVCLVDNQNKNEITWDNTFSRILEMEDSDDSDFDKDIEMNNCSLTSFDLPTLDTFDKDLLENEENISLDVENALLNLKVANIQQDNPNDINLNGTNRANLIETTISTNSNDIIVANLNETICTDLNDTNRETDPKAQLGILKQVTIKKKKKPLTAHQLAILRQEFKKSIFVTNSKARMLANDLGLSVKKVNKWFHNMRKKKNEGENESTKLIREMLLPEHLAILEKEFEKTLYFSIKQIKILASKLEVSPRTVNHWYIDKKKKLDTNSSMLNESNIINTNEVNLVNNA